MAAGTTVHRCKLHVSYSIPWYLTFDSRGWMLCCAQLSLCLWVCLLDVQCFHSLLFQVLFCCCWCLPTVLYVVCYYCTTLHHPHVVWSPIMVSSVTLDNHTMYPWSTVISLYGYHRPYGKEMKSLWVSLFLKYFVTFWGPHSFLSSA